MGKGSTDEEWVKAAMADDAMVVELLVRLHDSPPPPHRWKPAALPLEWSVRQRRSKSVSVTNNPKRPAHRGSPTTPLSWSSAPTFSGGSAVAGCGSFEESSRPVPFKLPSTTRSKGEGSGVVGSNLSKHATQVSGCVSTSACPCLPAIRCHLYTTQSVHSEVNNDAGKTVSKRSRKKKTLAELKNEESSLLKERRELKREMAALRMNLERQRATNDNFKRMKVELQPRLDQETSTAKESFSSQLQPESTSSLPIPPLASCDNDTTLQPSTPRISREVNTEPSDSKFALPDLNIPFDQALEHTAHL